MPYCVILNDELCCDRRAETQRGGRRPIQLVIRERAYCGGHLTTVPAQEFKRSCLRYPCLLVGMLGISTRRQPST
jgi:hypothetical protein